MSGEASGDIEQGLRPKFVSEGTFGEDGSCLGDELIGGKLNLGVESSNSGDPGSSVRSNLLKVLGLGDGVLGMVNTAGMVQNCRNSS